MAHIHHRRPRGMGGSRDPLTNGMDWGHGTILLGLFVGLVALSIPLFVAAIWVCLW